MDLGYILLNTIIYGGCALIISEVFSYGKFLHFAVGTYIMVAGYIFIFMSKFCLNVSNIIMIFSLLLFFFGVNYLLMRSFSSNKREQIGLIVTLGVSIFLESLGNYLYGASAVSFQSTSISNILLIVLLICLFCILLYFHKFSYIGKEFSAIDENGNFARELGIKTNHHVQVLSVFLFCIILLIAYLLVKTSSIRMQDGFYYMIKGIGIMMLVGLSRKEWLLLGALIYVIIEYLLFVELGLPIMYKESMTLVVIIFCLLYKPEGLFSFRRRSI